MQSKFSVSFNLKKEGVEGRGVGEAGGVAALYISSKWMLKLAKKYVQISVTSNKCQGHRYWSQKAVFGDVYQHTTVEKKTVFKYSNVLIK